MGDASAPASRHAICGPAPRCALAISAITASRSDVTCLLTYRTAGVSRSGAIVNAAVRMGFADPGTYRAPNARVLRLILEAATRLQRARSGSNACPGRAWRASCDRLHSRANDASRAVKVDHRLVVFCASIVFDMFIFIYRLTVPSHQFPWPKPLQAFCPAAAAARLLLASISTLPEVLDLQRRRTPFDLESIDSLRGIGRPCAARSNPLVVRRYRREGGLFNFRPRLCPRRRQSSRMTT